jgi:hypothetical protein
MHRIQRFVEATSGRIGYALTETALPGVDHGAMWKPDPSFNVADTILDNPEFVLVLRTVLRDGHVIVPTLKVRGNEPGGIA